MVAIESLSPIPPAPFYPFLCLSFFFLLFLPIPLNFFLFSLSDSLLQMTPPTSPYFLLLYSAMAKGKLFISRLFKANDNMSSSSVRRRQDVLKLAELLPLGAGSSPKALQCRAVASRSQMSTKPRGIKRQIKQRTSTVLIKPKRKEERVVSPGVQV